MPATPDEDEAAEAARLMEGLRRTGKDHCLLCGEPPYQMATWEPDADARRLMGLADDKTPVIAYCLCRDCNARRPASEGEALAVIVRQAQAMLRSPDAN